MNLCSSALPPPPSAYILWCWQNSFGQLIYFCLWSLIIVVSLLFSALTFKIIKSSKWHSITFFSFPSFFFFSMNPVNSMDGANPSERSLKRSSEGPSLDCNTKTPKHCSDASYELRCKDAERQRGYRERLKAPGKEKELLE